MVKNTGGGNRAKKQAKKRTDRGGTSGRVKTTRLAKQDGEVYAAVEKMMGGGGCHVTTYDGQELHCIIRNKFRGRGKRDNFIGPGIWVLIGLYEWGSSNGKKNSRPKCDLLEVYSDSDKEFLKQNEKLDLSKLNTIGVVNQSDDYTGDEITFVDEDTSLYEDIMNNEKTETLTFENNDNSNNEKTKDINDMNIDDIMDDI